MKYLLLIIQLLIGQSVFAQNPLEKDPWSQKQLMEPAYLMRLLKSGSVKPVILNIGTENEIRGAQHIGGAKDAVNLNKLQQVIDQFPKNTLIVLYCGCCPFGKCPNIRPAFSLLQKNKFRRFYILHLPHNIRTDWIEKGYPLAVN